MIRFGLVAVAAWVLLQGITGSDAAAQIASDTIHPGELNLPAPFLGVDTMDSYKVVNGERTRLNTWVRRIEVGIDDTIRILRVLTTHVSAKSGDTTKSHIILNAGDLSLAQQTVWSPNDSGGVYVLPSKIRGWISSPQVPWQAFTVMTGKPVFPDDGLAPWLLELLPYANGYRAAIARFNMWHKGETVAAVRVAGSEVLSNGVANVDCWVVDVDGAGGPPYYKQRRWVSKTSRRVLKIVMRKGGADPEYESVMRGWF